MTHEITLKVNLNSRLAFPQLGNTVPLDGGSKKQHILKWHSAEQQAYHAPPFCASSTGSETGSGTQLLGQKAQLNVSAFSVPLLASLINQIFVQLCEKSTIKAVICHTAENNRLFNRVPFVFVCVLNDVTLTLFFVCVYLISEFLHVTIETHRFTLSPPD